ncbi:hypothetical protein N2152v2_006071 [Parachlorella kessleri]
MMRQEASWVRASSGGGSGSGGSFGGSSGGGGGGGGDDGKDEQPQKPTGGFRWKGWEDRVAADPQFAYKVFIEQVIGVGASVAGDMAGRPNWGLNELDFVFATLVVGSIVNFALMWLLAPTASATGGASLGFFQRLFTEHNLVALGAPGGHMFQPGFSVGSRLINFVYKGFIFAFIGLCSGLVGTAMSNGLVALRKQLDPNFETKNTPPNVVGNASCWALHMGLSSNLRYQILNGLDMVLQPRIPTGLFRLFSAIVRSLNNMVGGVSFVMIAKVLGVQKAAEPLAEPVKAATAAAKKKSK